MKRVVFILVFAMLGKQALAWGFLGHKTINYYACFALPQDLFGFYKNYSEYVKTHAVDADSRRYLIDAEACRHYLDCDHYEHSAPLDTIPHRWFDAIEKYTEDTLLEYGIVPWHVLTMKYRLTQAFKEKNLRKILKNSADIGHYIADAHVPLHSTSNYNGQQTDQVGIHALWETRLPQLFYDSIDKMPGTVEYISNPQEFIWSRLSESYSMVDSVLSLEKLISKMHPNDKRSLESYGRGVKRAYSIPFSRDYYYALDNMVERRMLASIEAVASFWYTAWVDAGQPDLSEFGNLSMDEWSDDKIITPDLNQKMKGRQEYDIE